MARDKAGDDRRGVQLTKGSARELSEVLRTARGGNREQLPVRFRQADVGGSAIRLGTIAATWTKGQEATVTEQNGDGSAAAGDPTFAAVNYFATITVSTGTKRVACALVGSTWILIAAEC